MDLRTVAALTLSVALTAFAVGWLGARLSDPGTDLSSAGLIPAGAPAESVRLDARGVTGNW